LPSTFSASVDRAAFDALAFSLARDMAAETVLSVPGHPAATASLIGVAPVDELVMDRCTTPDAVKAFCFGSPGPAMGFVSYTYGLLLRGVATSKRSRFPLGHLKKYAAVAEYDDHSGTVTVTGRPDVATHIMRAAHHMASISTPAATGRNESAGTAPCDPGLAMSLDRAGYEAGVRETLALIRAGHIYQLNLSTRLSRHCPGLDPLALFQALWQARPAPFYAYFASAGHRVVSTSPERFLRVRDGLALSQPIKGTLRLDTEPAPGRAPDPDLVARLTGSAKEDAELSMIVDLIRNDLSANCEYGSVRVDNHKSVFAVDRLLQMYSDVTGRLRPDRDCLDLFFDAFPGGSVTGCPKKRSMEIIDALEPHPRDVYCGSILMVRDEKNMDSSVAIRTAVYDTEDERLDVWSGSGIVVDSDPASEYQETMAKAEKFLTPEE
jgi:para-aminobenzoate synthetase component 1